MAATYRITVNNQEPIILTDTMITFAVRKVLVGTDGQAMKSSPTVELDELCFNIADSTLNRVYETLKSQIINNLKIELYSKTSDPEGYLPLVEATGVKLVELQRKGTYGLLWGRSSYWFISIKIYYWIY